MMTAALTHILNKLLMHRKNCWLTKTKVDINSAKTINVFCKKSD